MTISDKLIQLNNTKQNIKQAIVDKGVDLTGIPFADYHTKIAEITGGGSGESKYPPIPTDGKTYLYVRLTKTTDKFTILALQKSDTSMLDIDWGDGTISHYTNSGNFNSSHTYSVYGDYIIKLWISSGGGTYCFRGDASGTRAVGVNIVKNQNQLLYCYLGNDVIRVHEYSFHSLNSLQFVYIPNTVTTIEDSAFRDLKFTELTIPESVTSIGDYALAYCQNIIKYVFKPTLPPTLVLEGGFIYINSICKIYVPDTSVDAYKTATNWVTYVDYIYPMSEMEGDN